MKNKIIIIVVLLSISGILIMPGCTKESSTPPVIYNAWTVPAIVSPASGSFVDVTGTTVDLIWQSTNADGDAQNWDVYFGTSKLTPALVATGVTAQKYTVPVDLGVKYYWKVVGTDKNGKTSTTTIQNFETIDPKAPLDMSMTWTTDALTAIGMNIDPLKAANLRLLIYKADSVTLATPVINTSDFEYYNYWDSLADGVYYVAADLASTINAGDLNATLHISINLNFTQRGIYSNLLQFPDAMDNTHTCPAYSTYMAKVTKTGDSYTVEKYYFHTPIILTWSGKDATYDSQVITTSSCSGPIITGLCNGWMVDFWGENIISGGSCSYTVSGNTITIPYQYYETTTYSGASPNYPPYYIQGTGTIDNSGPEPVWTLTYDLYQASGNGGLGGWICDWCYNNGYWPSDKLTAVITQGDSKGKGSVELSFSRPPRPNHH